MPYNNRTLKTSFFHSSGGDGLGCQVFWDDSAAQGGFKDASEFLTCKLTCEMVR